VKDFSAEGDNDGNRDNEGGKAEKPTGQAAGSIFSHNLRTFGKTDEKIKNYRQYGGV